MDRQGLGRRRETPVGLASRQWKRAQRAPSLAAGLWLAGQILQAWFPHLQSRHEENSADSVHRRLKEGMNSPKRAGTLSNSTLCGCLCKPKPSDHQPACRERRRKEASRISLLGFHFSMLYPSL